LKLYNYLAGIEILKTNIRFFDTEISTVTSRSEQIQKNCLFVCIKGMHSDGHDFAGIAKEKGAAALVVQSITDEVLGSGLPYALVKDTRRALALMCAVAAGNPERELSLNAVTGTNGKTSTVTLLKNIYDSAGLRCESLGTLNGGLTTPDPEDLFAAFKSIFNNGNKYVVMEASSHALALGKLYGLRFDSSIFTNLTPEHLDFHNTMEEYASAKAVLFEQSAVGLFNTDDRYGKAIFDSAACRKYRYSMSDKTADFYIDGYHSCGIDGIEYTLVTPNGKIDIKSSLPGKFNAYNTAAAAALSYLNGVDQKSIARGIENTLNIDGRLEKIHLPGNEITVYIDYAHSPDALEKVLTTIREYKKSDQKLTVLFGCGGDRDRSKRRIMGSIASRCADFVIITSDNSRSENALDIIAEIVKGIDKERPYIVIESRKEAIQYAINNASYGEIILLAGKGHENYEINGNKKTVFSEKEIAAEAFYKRFKVYDH